MTVIPSGALDAAAYAAVGLAMMVADFARLLPIEDRTGLEAARVCQRIERVQAPRAASAADVAAIGADLVSTVQAVARAADPSDAAAVLYRTAALTLATVPVSASPALTASYQLSRALAAGVETACLGEAFLAEARTAYQDRRAATQARERINAACDDAYDRIADTLGEPVSAALATVARETSKFLVEEATSLQPIVRVEAMRSFPSTALAWSLYGDPPRGDELVTRNRIGTPLFMPATIEAVGPSAR